MNARGVTQHQRTRNQGSVNHTAAWPSRTDFPLGELLETCLMGKQLKQIKLPTNKVPKDLLKLHGTKSAYMAI
jgi:hypothetical protein